MFDHLFLRWSRAIGRWVWKRPRGPCWMFFRATNCRTGSGGEKGSTGKKSPGILSPKLYADAVPAKCQLQPVRARPEGRDHRPCAQRIPVSGRLVCPLGPSRAAASATTDEPNIWQILHLSAPIRLCHLTTHKHLVDLPLFIPHSFLVTSLSAYLFRSFYRIIRSLARVLVVRSFTTARPLISSRSSFTRSFTTFRIESEGSYASQLR